jgi:hypothetical protein
MNPSLREYLEQRLDYERTLVALRFEQLEKRLERETALREDQLRLQAKEYERRLTALNHAHEAAVAESARVLPREIHAAFIKEYDAFKADTTKQLTAINTRSITWTAAIGLGFAILTVVLRFWSVG